MGDYAFVETPEGGVYMQINDEAPESDDLVEITEKNPINNSWIWGLRSVGKHQSDSADQAAYANYSTESANEEAKRKSEEVGYPTAAEIGEENPEFVQLGLDRWYTTFEEDSNPDVDDHGYQRVTTARFSADSDDIFMRSMIEQYAVEEGDWEEDDDGNEINCKPSGKFWMNKAGAYAASQEVLETHKGLSGAALQQYMDSYFEKAWGHFDVNLTGSIEVKMPQFMRFL